MTTEKLHEFLILSRTLNYCAAAKTLYISQSVLSKHIQSMEEELNTQLLIRTTHGVALTPAGQYLVQEISPFLEQCNSALKMIQFKDLSLKASINVACALELSYASHINIFIEKFMERYPDINVVFDVLSDGIPEGIFPKYDFIFTPCEYPNLPNNISTHLIQSHGVYAALYPGHRLLAKPLLKITELAGETIIVPFAHEAFGPFAKNIQIIKKYTRDQINVISVPNIASALFLVSIRKGITILPRYAKQLVPGSIITVGLSSSDCKYNEYLYYCNNKNNTAAELFHQEFCSTYLV
jgi:DNA-binding transcriptional LysR family regulator